MFNLSKSRAFLSASIMCALSGQALADYMPDMYFSGVPYGSSTSGPGTISRSVAQSNTQTTVVTTPYATRPMGVTVDGDSMYWASYDPGEIWRSDLDGQNQVRLAAPGPGTYTRLAQVIDGNLYWNEEATGVIKRANLDGSNPQIVVSGHSSFGPDGIWDYVAAGGRFYWTSWNNNKVFSTALDGSDFQQITVGLNRVFSIDTDGTSLLLGVQGSFSTPALPNQIIRMSLDGSQQSVLATVPHTGSTSLLAVSTFADRVYYGWTVGGGIGTSNIASVPIAGGASRMEMTLVNDIQLFQLDVVPAPGVSGFAIAAAFGAMRRGRRR